MQISLVVSQSGSLDALVGFGHGLSRANIPHRFVPDVPEGYPEASSNVKRALKQYSPLTKVARTRPGLLGSNRKGSVFFPQTPFFREHFSKKMLSLLEKSTLAYIPYQIYADKNPEYHFNLKSFRDFSLIFSANDIERKRFISAGIEPEKVATVGHPLVYETLQRMSERTSVPNPPVILWAPHWEEKWSHWRTSLRALSIFMKSHPDWWVLFRPHPLFLPAIRGELPRGYLGASAQAQDLRQLEDFLGLRNVSVSNQGIIEDIAISGVLLTEGKTLPALWEISGRPMAIICDQPSLKFYPEVCKAWIPFFIKPHTDVIIDWLSKATNSNGHEFPKSSQSNWLVYPQGKPLDPSAAVVEMLSAHLRKTT